MSTGSYASSPRTAPAIDTAAENARPESSSPFTAEATSGQSMDELRYLAAPIQRRPANGISARENAAVAHLSGGKVNLHAMGASVQRVASTDARLRAVGARSFAQGTQALVSSDADRGHEIWHLAQQAMGQVSADTTIGGQPVNTQASLEHEADRMGEAIARFSGPVAAAAPDAAAPPAIANAAAPVQRRVDSFAVDTSSYVPPTSDLLDTIDYDYFTESEKTVRSHVNARLVDTKLSTTDVPTRIEATIAADKKGDETPKRQTHKSGMVGKFGINEFYMRSGKTSEVFEGGHLIPHEIWATEDDDVDWADDYVNLVPMSRSLNVGAQEHSWRSIEHKILEAYKSLKGKATFSVGIDIEHEPYELSYDGLAWLFGLHVDGGSDGSDTIQMYGWLPTRIEAQDTTGKKAIDLGEAVENELHDTSTPITSAAELVEALKRTPLWLRMSESLRDDVEGL